MSAATTITATVSCWITASLAYASRVSAIRLYAAGSLPPCCRWTGNWKPPFSTGQTGNAVPSAAGIFSQVKPGKYCPDCAGRMKRIRAAQRKRKQGYQCHAFRICQNPVNQGFLTALKRVGDTFILYPRKCRFNCVTEATDRR